jgi:hypothetical protein
MDHIFFVHSSTGGHLGWFNNLAIVNDATANMAMHVSLCVLTVIPSGIYPEVVEL